MFQLFHNFSRLANLVTFNWQDCFFYYSVDPLLPTHTYERMLCVINTEACNNINMGVDLSGTCAHLPARPVTYLEL